MKKVTIIVVVVLAMSGVIFAEDIKPVDVRAYEVFTKLMCIPPNPRAVNEVQQEQLQKTAARHLIMQYAEEVGNYRRALLNLQKASFEVISNVYGEDEMRLIFFLTYYQMGKFPGVTKLNEMYAAEFSKNEIERDIDFLEDSVKGTIEEERPTFPQDWPEAE